MYSLGVAHFKARDYVAAQEAWENCTKTDPLNRFAWCNLAFLHCANMVPLKQGETNW